MVRVRTENKYATENKALTKDMIDNFFGRSLTLRRVTYTYDNFGQISAASTADTTFTGDLQYGIDLDQRYLKSGLVEVGEGILYIHPDELSTLPIPEDLIIDGSHVWELIDRVEAPELGGTTCHYSFKCRRQIESGDSNS